MESVFVPNRERSKIEYHRSRREQYRRYFQIKKGKEKTLFIYPRLLIDIPGLNFTPDYLETKEIARKGKANTVHHRLHLSPPLNSGRLVTSCASSARVSYVIS